MNFRWGFVRRLCLSTAACSGILLYALPATAQEKLVINDIAPWVKDDLSIEPRLLTTRDVESRLDDMGDKNDSQKMPTNTFTLPSDLSPLEKMYAGRLSAPVSQFGYEVFRTSQKPRMGKNRIPSGTVQDNFILNIGDELDIVMRGQKNDRKTSTITSEGFLLVDGLPPIMAAGKSLGDVRIELKSEVSRVYNTEVYLSLSHVAQVNVLVLGHVAHPGRQTLTSFDTVLDALIVAGGIEKTGTLRRISLIRNGRTTMLDLYGLLVFGNDAPDLNLRDGDKIMIRPVGPTIAVAGDVKRPGIYEILPVFQPGGGSASQKLSMNDLLNIAGGITSPAAHRFLRMDITTTGQDNVSEVGDATQRNFSDGDILNVLRGKELRAGTVQLIGNANQTGIHSLADKETLSDLLYDRSVLGPETYPLIGVIERWDSKRMAKQLLAFSPLAVLNGTGDEKLQDNDAVHLFSQKQIRSLQKPDPQKELENDKPKKNFSPDDEADEIDQALKSFLIERSVFVRGSVRNPGAYPIADKATLEDILSISGGTSLEGDKRHVEITSRDPDGGEMPDRRDIDMGQSDPGGVRLYPGDTVRFNQKFKRVEDNHVLILGEVKNSGTYDLQPGDTLGKLLARAGGITNDAYPEGAIFSRESERKREEARFKSQAQNLELKLAAALEQSDKDKKPAAEEIAVTKELITQLKATEALGRITVEADPGMLQSQPQLDILLENGDRIYIPKRPLTVRVAGEVLSPASLQFRTEKSPRDYIEQAGGTTYNADIDRAFVVYPDGSAQPLAVSSWSHNAVFVPPGSTIIVPRDPKPFDFMDNAKDISQILANVATAAIFADALGDDDD